ncbi:MULTISPECIES: hypothetical protein [unclassified Actinopolyspora]|uniref:hypothetical protein n=1 Tax=Actinopolyspora TaxID=1849 RepID=UPI0013F68ACE|nr:MULTISPECIES: hypothetical protein [unclassified Actinopolyspora]NHD19199.1 hypothetical protein [Actinopolyspora sp. BKK2]NHE78323.1 hypothetical protein [Actinopolyspora sp. BKK1]
MVDVADGAGPAERLHDLLLNLTGRLDDDAVNTARELAGAGQTDAAAELVTGSLLAGGIVVNRAEQRELATILGQANSRSGLAERLVPGETGTPEPHRFTEPERVDDLVAALRAVAPRLPNLRSLWCAARTTAAGVAAEAVPRRVLLAEVDGSTAVGPTGYQLVQALRRSGTACSVEAFETGSELPEYHRDALAVSHEVELDQAPVDLPGATRHEARGNHSFEDFTKQVHHQETFPEPAPTRARQQHESSTLGEEPDLGSPAVSTTAEWPVVEQEETDRSDYLPQGLPPIEDLPPYAPYQGERSSSGEPDPEQTGFILDDRPAADISGSAPREFPEQEFPERGGFPEREFPERGNQPDSMSLPSSAAGPPAPAAEPAPAADDDSDRAHSPQPEPDEPASNPNVPAAVDAKLTDRERNLLRKLHEELAQREQDREPDQAESQDAFAEPAPRASGETQQDPRTTTVPGTGNFPPIGSVGPQQP